MAIKAGMTIAQAVAQLTKGFVKVMKRKPEALEKIKIQQEAAQKVRDLNKVVDMEGNVIDTSKGIMGGREIKAMGGRIGYKDGPDVPGRRKFMKIMGGLATIPFIGKYFKSAKTAAPAVEKAVEVAGQAPSYFFDLVTKIKTLGKTMEGPQERVKIHTMPAKDGKSELMLTEDIGTGEIQIKKISKNNSKKRLNYFNSKIEKIRVIRGTNYDYFSVEGKKIFFEREFVVSKLSDRMGMRLEGQKIENIVDTNIKSEGLLKGVIQIPADGNPIIMLSDHGTIGGYPKIGVVISADYDKLVQISPGSKIKFQEIELSDAETIFKLYEMETQNLISQI